MPARQAGGPYGRGDFRFTQYTRGLTDAHERAAERTADWAVTHAKGICPVDTGALRDSIEAETRSTQTGVAIVVYAGQEYALYVELGTSRMAAQPFLRPTMDRIMPQHTSFLRAEVRGVAA